MLLCTTTYLHFESYFHEFFFKFLFQLSQIQSPWQKKQKIPMHCLWFAVPQPIQIENSHRRGSWKNKSILSPLSEIIFQRWIEKSHKILSRSWSNLETFQMWWMRICQSCNEIFERYYLFTLFLFLFTFHVCLHFLSFFSS